MRKFSLAFLLVGFVSLVSLSCGGGGGGGADGDSTAPTVLGVQPAAGPINGSAEIVITFDETMDTGSLVLGGTLGLASDNGTWSDTSVTDDTLTIGPFTTWAEGVDQPLYVQVSDLAGNSLTPLNLLYTVDTTAPTGSETPAGGASLASTGQVVITFDESMDTTSLILGGDLTTQAHSAVWSSTVSTDDTLTITPSSAWSGAALAFTVDADDLAGNPLPTMNLSYTVTVPPLSVTVAPLSWSDLDYGETITLTYSRSMNAASLSVTGVMAPESDGGVWSSTSSANDTLKISPASTWTKGVERMIAVSVEDVLGNPGNVTLFYNVANPIYVSRNFGNDGWPGTKQQPKRTIADALTVAAASSFDSVYLMGGDYPETVNLQDGIDLLGGFDVNWTYDTYGSAGHTVTVTGGLSLGQYVTVRANGVTSSMTNLVVQAPDAVGTSGGNARSSYGVHVRGGADLTLQDVRVVGGGGADGPNGNNGAAASTTPAANGTPGQDADSYFVACNDTSAGTGGAAGDNASAAGLGGGAGGKGGTMDTDCSLIIDDLNATAGFAGVNAETYVMSGYGYRGAGGATCSPGAPGNDGQSTDGDGGTMGMRGGSVVAEYWAPSAGGPGTTGTHGTGGGGGGGSGGCDTGTDSYGAGGGGGGAGGVRAPVGGAGGMGGGSSFGLFAVNSTVTVSNTVFERGTGGDGGSGGSGAAGQPGGLGGNGGLAAGGSGPGGAGGDGADGGDSGGGGGGAGGNAYSIYSVNSTLATSTVTHTGGAGGQGGPGGGSPSPDISADGAAGQGGLVYGIQ